MPLFYQQDINDSTRLGVWLIREKEAFFLDKVPLHRSITHPHKRLQHLAGRYLLKYLFPDFPHDLIRIADTRKPFLQNDYYHFSISHSADYASALVSKNHRVGVDVEVATAKIEKILHKFLNEKEQSFLKSMQSPVASRQSPVDSRQPVANNVLRTSNFVLPTLLWSAKESVFKWYGEGAVDFSEHILLEPFSFEEHGVLQCNFTGKTSASLQVNYRLFNELCLSWTVSDHTG